MEETILKDFGAHLKALRLERGLSQAEFAYNGSFNRNYIGMVERGERNPSLKTLCRIADALGVSLSELFNFQLS